MNSISCDEEVFQQAAPLYDEALQTSGYTEKIRFHSESATTPKNGRKRKRKIIWFNPPFSQSVTTNVGRRFLSLVQKHFPPGSRLAKIFNRNSVKVSYSCMPNVAAIIRRHNRSVLKSHDNQFMAQCNCRNKEDCPLNGDCQQECVIYRAEVTDSVSSSKPSYIGLTEGSFKKRYYQHTQTFRHEKYQYSTELSKYIWQLKRQGTDYSIKWSIIIKARPYSNTAKRCDLCISEKLHILEAKSAILNKRSELISKCRHENKFYLCNFTGIT